MTAPKTASTRSRLAPVAGAAAGFILGLALAWLVGLVWFAASVPNKVHDRASATDAIVVLTGGSERVSTGVTLLEEGLGHKLFVSGVHRGVDVAELLRSTRARHPELACCIVLGYSADDTVGNAAETAAWIRSERFASLRLVTAAYHMRRSLLEFRRAMPEATIIPHPVFPDSVKSEWWRWPGTAHLLATEYTKYLAAVVRHWFVPAKERP
ncbi:MAG: YdcF family protein [Actinomycetota bacterium]